MRALSEAELFDVNAGFNPVACGQLMLEGGMFFGGLGVVAGGAVGGFLGSIIPGAGTVAGGSLGAYYGGMLGTLAGGAIAAEEGAVCS